MADINSFLILWCKYKILKCVSLKVTCSNLLGINFYELIHTNLDMPLNGLCIMDGGIGLLDYSVLKSDTKFSTKQFEARDRENNNIMWVWESFSKSCHKIIVYYIYGTAKGIIHMYILGVMVAENVSWWPIHTYVGLMTAKKCLHRNTQVLCT